MKRSTLVRASLLITPLLAACGGGGSGGTGTGGGSSTAPPLPAERRTLTLTDSGGMAVNPSEILTTRAAVVRGDDAILFIPVGGTINGTNDTAAVRLAKDGSVKWAHRYHLPELAFVGDAVDDGEGVSFVAGQDETVYVVRIDDEGALRALQTYEVPGAGQLSATVPLTLASLDDHGLLVGTGAGVMRLGADGTVMWSTGIGSSVQRVAVLPGGDFAAVGDNGGMRVARLAPDGKVRFIGAGGIKGNFFHAGIVGTSDGGLLVISGVDAASEELVGIVTARISADGATGTLEGVQMDATDDMGHDVPYQFGSGAHLRSAGSGRVWGSFQLSSGALGANIHGPIDVAFDDGKPTEAVGAAIAFGFTDNALVGVEAGGMGQDVVIRAPRPQLGECINQPHNVRTKVLATGKYALVANATVTPVMVAPVDAKVVVDDLKATLSDNTCM